MMKNKHLFKAISSQKFFEFKIKSYFDRHKIIDYLVHINLIITSILFFSKVRRKFMKKVSERNVRIFATICFLIVGILNMIQKKYILGSLFIILTISYTVNLILEKKKEEYN